MTAHRWTPAYGRPGELVVAAVYNPLESPSSRGKNRPVVLVRRDGARWHVMGLTTNAQHRDGTPRRAVPHPHANGLNAPGYLWSRQLTGVSVLDIGQHIGWVDPSLAATIVRHAHLGPHDAAALICALETRSTEISPAGTRPPRFRQLG